MIGFTEARETISNPEKLFILLEEDGESYIFRLTGNTPIKAGSFYKYSDNLSDEGPDIAVDNICFRLNEGNENHLVLICSKEKFDLGSVYTNVSGLTNIGFQDNFVTRNAQKNFLTYRSSGDPVNIAVGFRSGSESLVLYPGYQMNPPMYYKAKTDTPWQTFYLYFSEDAFITLEYITIIYINYFSNYTESY